MRQTDRQIVPAPWKMTGSGYILLYRWFPRDFVAEQGRVPPSLSGGFKGGASAVIVADYDNSGVGPYRELLFIPGMFERGFSITRIYVSTLASVVSGRANWGIPKEHAEFDFQREKGIEHIRVSCDGEPFFQATFQSGGLWLPFSNGFFPLWLVQALDGRLLSTRLTAKGWLTGARLREISVNERFFPDVSRFRALSVLHVPRFEMTFPAAKMLSW